jgi:hypothetical protein
MATASWMTRTKRNQWRKFICHVKLHWHALHRITVDYVAGPGSRKDVRAVQISSHGSGALPRLLLRRFAVSHWLTSLRRLLTSVASSWSSICTLSWNWTPVCILVIDLFATLVHTILLHNLLGWNSLQSTSRVFSQVFDWLLAWYNSGLIHLQYRDFS